MPRVRICEVSPRDGLQYFGGTKPSGDRLVSQARKIQLITELARSGVHYIEVGAFVNPRVTPQMADTLDVLQAPEMLSLQTSSQLAALVPNEEGYRAFQETRLNTVAFFISSDHEHNIRNLNKTVDESIKEYEELAPIVKNGNGKKTLRAHVSGAFVKIADGRMNSDIRLVKKVARALVKMNCDYIALADTNGEANPLRIKEVIRAVSDDLALVLKEDRDKVTRERIAVHLHDRNGAGMANLFAAYEEGVRTFDCSVGGIGGSEIASMLSAEAESRDLAGNIATEEVVDMFERMGVETGVNLDSIFAAGEIVQKICVEVGEFDPPSKMLREHLRFGSFWSKDAPTPVPPTANPPVPPRTRHRSKQPI